MVRMTATPWQGWTYGFSIRAKDRAESDEVYKLFDWIFQQGWDHVFITLPNRKVATANIDKDSFWDGCPELITVDIEDWLKQAGHVSRKTDRPLWGYRRPPKFQFIYVNSNKFRLGKEVKRKK